MTLLRTRRCQRIRSPWERKCRTFQVHTSSNRDFCAPPTVCPHSTTPFRHRDLAPTNMPSSPAHTIWIQLRFASPRPPEPPYLRRAASYSCNRNVVCICTFAFAFLLAERALTIVSQLHTQHLGCIHLVLRHSAPPPFAPLDYLHSYRVSVLLDTPPSVSRMQAHATIVEQDTVLVRKGIHSQ